MRYYLLIAPSGYVISMMRAECWYAAFDFFTENYPTFTDAIVELAP